MAKKYNDNSHNFRDWTTARLKKEAASLDALIHVEECYGTKDVLYLELCLRELAVRGVKAFSVLTFTE